MVNRLFIRPEIKPSVDDDRSLMPLFSCAVSAGFPSPAQDYVDRSLDLNEYCIAHPASTFFVRAKGLSMVDAGIFPDDLLIVDRALTARSGDIVIARLFDDFTVKQLELGNPLRLLPRNSEMQPIVINAEDDLEIIGVVTCALHRFR